MKKKFFATAAAMLIIGTIFTGCESQAQKEETAKEKVQDAKEDLKEEQQAATDEEWNAFKAETEIRISKNEVRIAEIKVEMKKPGKLFEPLHKTKIAELEQKNRDMRAKIEAYDKSQSNWESFKREFNHDMDELGQALKDITVDNKS